MLDSSIEYPTKSPEAYKLSLPQCNGWSVAKKRVLIVMQTVDGRDLRNGAMLGDTSVKTCFVNSLKYTRSIVRTYNENATEAAYTIVNFNGYRHLHLSSGPRKQAEAEFAARIHRLIARIKPTHVLVSGDEAFHAMWPEITNHTYKRGWIHRLKSGELELKVTSTLDFSRLLEKDGQYANLLGFWCRHFCNLMLGKNPHDLSHVVVEPRYIDTLEKFDRMMALLWKSKITAIDTETRDLSVLFNTIYTIQFAMDEKPNVGYVLPLNHPMTPWSKEDLKYIRGALYEYFTSRKRKQQIFFNGMYDLRVIRRYLKIPIIWHDAWEITSGEHSLDENIVELANFNSKPGNLAAVYCSYGNAHYYGAAFSKADRNTTGNVKPNDKNFLLYAATDVVSLVWMRREQIKRAQHQFIDGHVYEPFFVRHMLHQMSDTAHQLSHLREDGSLVDAKYLRFLTSAESPLLTEMKILSNAFRAFPEALEANKRILAEAGFKAKGLFARSKALNWALSLSKPNHLRVLFFDVMGLEAINKTKEGTPSVDKAMVAEYKDKNPIVASYGDYTKLSKLLGTYAKGWFKKLRGNRDSIEDHHLRPDYSSFDVATGRLASKNPSLQTIPSRGKLVKIIKKMFIAPRGTLLVRYDYSAHEVRVWSYVSGDKVLADIFKVGQKLRQLFIKTPSIPHEDTQLKNVLDEWFTYHPDTGIFTWKKANGTSNPIGKKAGSKRGTDGFYLNLHGKIYRANRAAFLMTYGYLPEEVDHKDNDIYNNRIKNLRPATRLENSRNRRMDSTKTSSGYKGVYPGPCEGTWVAQIKPGPGAAKENRVKHLGVFDSAEDAHKAYVRAAKKYHKNFANDGVSSLAKEDGDYRHPSVIAKADIKLRGDIHILNVKRLLNKDVDKDHPLRDAIKQVIFGLLYGKSAETLGQDTKLGDKMEYMAKIGDPETPEKEVKLYEKKLTDLLAEDRTPYAQGLIDKIFQEFRAGGRWTNKMKKMAEEAYYVFSPIGRKRNLFAALTGDRKIVSQQVRRGSNAPIQGFASEIGVKAGRLVMEKYYDELPEICRIMGIEYDPWVLRVPYNRMVHDASYYSVMFKLVIPFVHILQYCATYGITKSYKDEFGFEFTVEPEIELEFGVRDDCTHKWDWSLPNIVDGIVKSVDEAEEFGMLDRPKDEILKEIFRPWAKKEMRTMLQEKYPLLNVSDLDKQIVDAIRPIFKKKEAATV